MNAAYFDNNRNETATFDLFIRKLPKDWGFFIANGIEDALDYITTLGFNEEGIAYLRAQEKFKDDFLDYLKDFKFTGDVWAVKEGTPVAPNTPILRVTAPRMEGQFIESALLNMINFQTMIATKANRVVNAAQGADVIDFGLRRAQEEDAAMKGARAGYIAGCVGTSNVKVGMEYGIPISGTHAHSFIMSFPTELAAFRAYVKTFPDKATLLIDTYDTIQGAKNAAIVAKELEKEGRQLGAIRLDSGDLTDLSKRVRAILDEQGLDDVKITASNDLNEYKIAEMIANGARIDAYGVGTEMITAKPVAAVSGVYKLVEDDGGAKIKLAPGKKTYPGKKQICRIHGEDFYAFDVLDLESEHRDTQGLLGLEVQDGKRVNERKSLDQIREYALREVAKMPPECRQVTAEEYGVRISGDLQNLINKLTSQFGQEV